MEQVQFARMNKSENAHHNAVVDRAKKLLHLDVLSLRMDLSAVHFHTPLNFRALATFDDFNFTHDIMGIVNHIDRATGELRDCFLPRCARKP